MFLKIEFKLKALKKTETSIHTTSKTYLQRFEMVQVTFLRKGAGVSDFTRASRGCIDS